MTKKDIEEKVYYEDLKTRVTASFVAGYKQIILPVERIDSIIVTHKSFSMYLCFCICLLLLTMLLLAPFGGIFGLNIPMEVIFLFFVPVFGCACVWFRFIYENYVELYVVLDDRQKYKLRVITLGKRTVIYDIADAIRAAVSEYRARSAEEAMLDTDSLKIRRLRNVLMHSDLDMTPEIMNLLNVKNGKKTAENVPEEKNHGA